MPKFLTLFAILAVTLTSVEAFAGSANRTYQTSTDALFSLGSNKCGGKILGNIVPTVTIDGSTGCNSVPNTYLYKKTVTNSDGERSEVVEIRKLEDTYSESASVAPDGTESLTITITSGRSVDTNLGSSRSLSVSDLTNIFGDAETASKLSKTMSHGLAAARRSHQDPIPAE